jgi:small subunit ribosomal protein S16
LPVKMRLRRVGAKHQPSYRIVIADSRSPRDGRYIDQVGFYNPLTNPATITVNRAKAIDWLQRGAQPTETVEILLRKFDIRPQEVRKGQLPAEAEGIASQGPSKSAWSAQPEAAPVAEAPVAEAPVASTPAAETEVEETREVDPGEVPVPEEGGE